MLMGGIIGDFVGRPYEWHNTSRTDFELITEQSGFTDDTVLTIATAESLLSDRDYAATYYKWASAYPMCGYGPKFRQWVGRGPGAPPYWSFGNGAAMRVPPVAWAVDCLDEVLAEAERSAEVTHNHPEGIQGAQALAAGVFLYGQRASELAIREVVEARLKLPLRFDVAHWRALPGFSAHAIRTVPVAFAAVFEATDFEHAIRLAISAGGDSDTIGSMAGALAEARWGVPEALEARIRGVLPEGMREVLARFEEVFGREDGAGEPSTTG